MGDRKKRKVAIIHYHLRRGGVARVIEASAAALEAHGHAVTVLSGEAPYAEAKIPHVRVIPALQYRRTGSPEMAESLVDRLKRAAVAELGGLPDVWHFHNPTLAKNVLFPTMIRELASEGARLLLQIHDFAEDGRPGNYASQRSYFDSPDGFEKTFYPLAKHIHYATLNRRDRRFLRSAGVPSGNVHVIPNSVPELRSSTSPADRPFSQGRRFAFYPTRGIRRKNLGELLLLSLAYGDEVDFATSLRPENPEWMQIHNDWEALIAELKLPVRLGLADEGGYPFLDLLGWSDFIVTTSMAEGFGLVYLEPWLAGKSLMGRDLPEITQDFETHGIRLDSLYHRIHVPVDWVGSQALTAATETMLQRTYLAYDCPLPRSAVKAAIRAWVQSGAIDFGILDEKFQQQILRKLHADRSLLKHISLPPLPKVSAAEIAKQGNRVTKGYGLNRYGEHLEEVYGQVAHSSVGRIGHLATHRVLSQFLDPSRLSLLRNG